MTKATDAGIQKLYHYQRFEPNYLKDSLTNQRFHFSNPQNFNDPWDCCPWFDPTEVSDPSCRAKWVRFLEPLVQNLPPAEQEALKTLGTKWQENSDFLIKTIWNMTASTQQILAEHWRIYCLTPHPDSTLMWSHYADKHKGICLEFDAGENAIGSAFQVVYKDSLPVLGAYSLSDSDAVAQILLNKSSDWAYEHEYRVLARDSQADSVPPKFLAITDSDFLSLQHSALTAVIAGCSAELDAIKTLVREHAPAVQVKRAVRARHKYSISIENCVA
jgi:hypothetical protein